MLCKLNYLNYYYFIPGLVQARRGHFHYTPLLASLFLAICFSYLIHKSLRLSRIRSSPHCLGGPLGLFLSGFHIVMSGNGSAQHILLLLRILTMPDPLLWALHLFFVHMMYCPPRFLGGGLYILSNILLSNNFNLFSFDFVDAATLHMHTELTSTLYSLNFIFFFFCRT